MLHPENTLGKTDMETESDRKMDFKVMTTPCEFIIMKSERCCLKQRMLYMKEQSREIFVRLGYQSRLLQETAA